MARDGWNFVVPLVVLVFLCVFAARSFGLAGWLAAGVFLALAVFCAYFFRDPVRVIPADPGVLISPTDGQVILVKDGQDPFVGPCREIHIFMNLFNVHIQRSPFTVPAKVRAITYNKGKFMAADVPKASLENEQNWIGLEALGRKVLVKQIAGLVARRILCWAGEGQEVMPGQKIGLIRFGSQVDLLVPRDSEVLVEVGDKVAGGETLMARLAGKSSR